MAERRATDQLDPTQAGESTTDDDKQPSALDDEALLRRLKSWFVQAKEASSDWRKNAREDYAFYSGEQWDQKDKAILMDQLRPVITFNRVAPTIDTVAGMEVNNRQEIRCYPRVASSQPSPQAPSSAMSSIGGLSSGAMPNGSSAPTTNGLQPGGLPDAGYQTPTGPSALNGSAPNRLGLGVPPQAQNVQAPGISQASAYSNGNGQGASSMTGAAQPIAPSEPAQAESITDAIKWVRDECDAEDEESEAFIDAVICGLGRTETRLDYETDPDGMIDEDRVDPLEMYWDAYARKRNLTDARHVFHRTEMDLE